MRKALLSILAIAILLTPAAAQAADIEKELSGRFGEDILKIYRTLDGKAPLLDALQKAGIEEGRRNEAFVFLKDKVRELNEKAVSLYSSTNPEGAIPYAKEALAITEKTLGRNHGATAKTMNFLAELYKLTGRPEEAEALYKKTIDIYRGLYGNKHAAVANGLLNLANVYTSMGRRAEVIPLYEEAVEIFKAANGKDHPTVATALSNLAMLYDSMGKLAEAEPRYREAVTVSERANGKDHPSVAANLNNLGILYYSSGKYGEAEPLYKRALEIYTKAYGKKHPAVSTAMNNLGLLYTSTGMYDRAEPYFKEALAIDEGLYGEEHSNLVSDLNNLANLYKDMGRLKDAEPLYRRSLDIGEKTLGRDNPALAAGNNNLALLYYATGRLQYAEPLLKRALDIGKKTLGEEHPDVAAWMNNLALLYAAQGRHEESFELFRKGAELEYAKREDVFTLLPEDQKLTYMKRTEGAIHAFINLTARHLPNNEKAIAAAFDSWLRWKGAIMETQQRYQEAMARSADPAVKAKFEQMNSIRRRIAKMKLEGPKEADASSYKKQLNLLEAEKQAVESELSRLSKDFALEKVSGRADTAKIASLLPADSAYIDFAYVRTYDFAKRETGDFRYAAFVLLPGPTGPKPTVKAVDLGDAREINGHIKAYLEEMKSPVIFQELPREKILSEEASALYKLLIMPIAAYVKGRKTLLISPEGNLSLMPFETLTDPSGRYLIEDYGISYITAGRDIVRFTDETASKNAALLMSDPDYDQSTRRTGGGGVSKDMAGMRFVRLPDTAKEAEEIEKILIKEKKFPVQSSKGKDATEEALFRADSPRILHLATHGYFLSDAGGREESGTSLGLMLLKEQKAVSLENPMLRSGIVLAGANVSIAEGRDGGVVSADKALSLKLRGTELVVLSACDTGVGDIQRGEGVFGMRRAFILAGAKSLVMSLWSVPSNETRELMGEFYRQMAEGKGKAEALRLARLEIKRRYGNPFFWGAFVITGNPN